MGFWSSIGSAFSSSVSSIGTAVSTTEPKKLDASIEKNNFKDFDKYMQELQDFDISIDEKQPERSLVKPNNKSKQ